MDYRDWWRGDLAQRGRQPDGGWLDDGWLDDGEPRPGGPHWHTGEGYRTSQRPRDRFTDTTQWQREDLAGLDQGGNSPRPGAGPGDTAWSEPAEADHPSPKRYRSPAPAGPPAISRRAVPVANRRRASRRQKTTLLKAEPGGPIIAVLYAAAWYTIPVLVLFLWMLALDTSVPIGCVTDVTGGGCQSERARALAALLNGAPRFGIALLASLAVAALLHWASGTWRSASVGLAAAVVGGGLSTVLLSVISGRPLG